MPNITYYWSYNTSNSLMQVSGTDINKLYDLNYIGTTYSWDMNKNYQFEVQILGFTSASFSISPNWSDRLLYDSSFGTTPSNILPINKTQSFYLYSSPNSSIYSTTHIKLQANKYFTQSTPYSTGLLNFKIQELDFKIQGFSYYKETSNELNISNNRNGIGWHYDILNDTYFWHDRVAGSPSSISNVIGSDLFPVGGLNSLKKSDYGYRMNNYISKFIPYTYFNMSFFYQNTSNFPLNIYLSPSLPSSNPSSWNNMVSGTYQMPQGSTLIASLTYSGTMSIGHSFYGLRGNQYIYLVGGYAGVSSSSITYSNIFISNIKVDGGYNDGNNRQYLMTNNGTYSYIDNYSPIGLINATYSSIVGNGNTVNSTQSLFQNKIYSKIGNGLFLSGIWENGVWNSGWRVDNNMFEFYDIYQYFSYNTNKRWRVQIIGPTSSVNNFNIGDNVSIGNIIAIDINEDRRLLKNYFTIIGKSDESIIVEFDIEFPLRRIEKDSSHHRINVTKNIWLSGGFLNGYFKGIWNYGLFKGYPLITEMHNSNWIDGIFDGGHFKSTNKSIPDFVDTIYSDGKVGFTFSSPHGLSVNDIITIDKSNKYINPQYDGEAIITSIINQYHLVTNIDWGEDSILENGKVYVDISDGIIQKMDFKSNNKSKITSIQSYDSSSVFMYDSWMDVNYYNDSAVNIGKPQTMLNQLSNKQYSENNLYGYPTNDILESNSSFRDSFSLNNRKYKLGTKYKIFDDFIGDSGKFDNHFGTYSETSFLNQGWTFSRVSDISLLFSRTDTINIGELNGEELRVQSIGYGGILDISQYTSEDVLNRTYDDIQKNRYTKVEFDVITYSAIDFYQNGINFSLSNIPNIHFNNINKSIKEFHFLGSVQYGLVDNTFLPIYENINHLKTTNIKKVEYFFNKRNLSMHFHGNYNESSTTTAEYIIDNLHFYEVDMIPFFKYFTISNINKGIQVPYQGISPYIDYTNSNFNFIDNILIGLDSISIKNSYIVISGVGIGIDNYNNSVSNNNSIIFNIN